LLDFFIEYDNIVEVNLHKGQYMMITFCGHADFRGDKESEKEMMAIFEEEIGDADCEMLFGEYGKFDSFAFSCGQKYRKQHTGVKLIFVTPYVRALSQKTDACKFDEIIYPCQESIPYRFAILHRNRWMVERAGLIIAFVNRSWGGAYQSYLHAKRKQKRIINLAKRELR